MACKKDIEAQGGVLKWLSIYYNSYLVPFFVKGDSDLYLVMSKDLYQAYEDSIQTHQKWVPGIFDDGTPIIAKDIGPVMLMFKASKCYQSKKLGWALTIVGPYGILEA